MKNLSFKFIVKTLVIVVAGLWIFWPALCGGWLWDDSTDITDNAITRSPTGLWSIWFEPGTQLDYYPVKASVQWVQWHLWGEDTFGYHLTNVLLHIVGALLVWRLFTKLGLRLAWLGGLFFAIHPTAVESVAWIAELKNTLSLPPFLLAMCFYLDYDTDRRPRAYWLALGFFLVAMLTKTTMVMFPVVILLYAWWKRGRIGWADLKASALFFVISLVLGLVTLWVGHWYAAHHPIRSDTVPLGGFLSKLARTSSSLSFYFSKVVLPIGLVPLYPQWRVNPPSMIQFLPLPILAAVIYGCWLKRRNWGRHVALGLGFFVIMLAPFVTVNVGGYAALTWVMDHFLYIPILGVIGLGVAGLELIETRLSPPPRLCGIGLVAVVFSLLAWGSHDYAKKFISQEVLWTYTLKYNPDAWLAHNNLGTALLEKGQLTEAMDQFAAALKLHPHLGEAHSNWGVALVKEGRIPEAFVHYQEAVRINPYDSQTHYDWGNALLKIGQPDEAMKHYQEALRIKPEFAEAHANYGNVLLKTGQINDAIRQYQEALQLKPDYPEALYNLGNAFLQNARYPEAVQQFEEVLRLKPGFVEARYNLGNAFLQSGQLAEATRQYQLVLQLKSDHVEAHNNLGIALAQMGRVEEAMAQFEETLRLNPNFVGARQNLATLQADLKNAKK